MMLVCGLIIALDAYTDSGQITGRKPNTNDSLLFAVVLLVELPN